MTDAAQKPLVVCVAPNGARRTHADHPALPMTPAEIGREAARCAEAGARVLHLHVRNAEGGHSLDTDIYAEAIRAVQKEAGRDLLIQVTTEAVGIYAPPQQMHTVRTLRPEAASVALREFAPDDEHLPAYAEFVRWCRAEGIGLQHILYAPEEVERFRALVEQGVLEEDRPHALFVLGRYTAGQQSSPRDLEAFVGAWTPDWPFSVCAFGLSEQACLLQSAAAGGHVRIGFENNLLTESGEMAESNGAQIRALLAKVERPLAEPATARALYNVGVRR